MLQIPVKEGESIERALKKYKKKFERTGVLKELRARKEYTKKSIVRRQDNDDFIGLFYAHYKDLYPKNPPMIFFSNGLKDYMDINSCA